MRIEEISEAVKAMYPSGSWAHQVDKMPKEQIMAIYLSNLENPPPLPQKESPPEQGILF